MMQAIRDLVTLPRGTNPPVDELLDHAIVVVIPTTNPDGRVAGRRQNEEPLRPQPRPARPVAAGDPRQHRLPARMARPGRAVHARVLQPDPRRRADEAAQPGARVRQVPLLEPAPSGRQPGGHRGDRPNHPAAGQPVGPARGEREQERSPAVAEGWDDWGPFYSQTYGAFFGVDGSTVEMCDNAACGGRSGRSASSTSSSTRRPTSGSRTGTPSWTISWRSSGAA